MVSLARVPQARIGSFQFHHNGTITLTNRPLMCSMAISENDGATQIIQRNSTFNCSDAYVTAMLDFHDPRFLSQPNAVFNEDDCHTQMAVNALLRAISHDYTKKDLRLSPYFLQLTDFHASNIFVGADWNVTGLIDLEWICALPSELFAVPYWLTGCTIDGIEDDKLSQFDQVRRAFLVMLKEEEHNTQVNKGQRISISEVMADMWDSKGVWFWCCLSSVNAMYTLLESHLLPPKSLSLSDARIVSRFRRCKLDHDEVVQMKLAEKEAYNNELRQLFI